MAPETFFIHVRTVTGLEEILAEELKALGAQEIEVKSRLVICRGNLQLLYKINFWSRTAIRVLRPLKSFPARDEKALYEGIRSVDWSTWLKSNGTLAVDADVRSSFTTHSLFVAQLTKDAVVDQFREKTGKRPNVDLERPDLRIVVSLFQDVAQVYLDSSGGSLHKRGYRKKAGEAPLSETLAAGIIKLSHWDQTSPFIDPMCGSGTLCIEAGLMVKNIAPGLLRNDYGFQQWPDYDRSLYEGIINQAKKAIRHDVSVPIIGVEIDPTVVEIAKDNVERAGLTGLIQIERGDFFEWEGFRKFANGTLVLNPPYDERLPVDNVAELYQKIGDRFKAAYGGWKAFVLCGNLDAIKYIGLRSSRRIVLYNGSLESRLLEFEIRGISQAAPEEGAGPKWRQTPAQENPRWRAKAETFGNRLRKNYKHFSKWAKREGISAWRLYDWDIPELAFYVDIYGDRLHFAEVERNTEDSPIEHARYVQMMVALAAEIAGIAKDKVYFKKRKPQKSGGFQYTPHAETGEYIEVTEGGHRFLVNLADYLDVGLFLDHRKTRAMVQKESQGKDVLNLFAYTGSFTIYAAAGGAKSTTTVDTSNAYLEWAERNLKLNGLSGSQHKFLRADALEFLERSRMQFDLAIVDPPTRSVNRSSQRVFDVQTDHVELLRLVLNRLRPEGKIYFSTNYRTFQLDEAGLKQGRDLHIKEITSLTLSPDFEHHPSHRCWVIEKKISS